MAVDLSHEYSDKQSVICSSGSDVVCSNPDYNDASPKDAFGVAKALEIGGSFFNCMVTTALVGAATMTCKLMTKAADASLSSGGTLIASVEFAATAAARTVKSVKIAPGTERLAYLGVVYRSTGAKTTAGNINANLGTAPAITD